MLGVVARDEKPTEDPLFVRDAAYVQKTHTENMCVFRETVCTYTGMQRHRYVYRWDPGKTPPGLRSRGILT